MSNLKFKLGARIQEIRKSKNITQEKLAELINMDTSNLSNIERGKKFMTADTIEKILSVLNISAKDLFDFDHIKEKNELEYLLQNKIKLLNYKELIYMYKTIDNLIQLR